MKQTANLQIDLKSSQQVRMTEEVQQVLELQ